MNNEWETKFEEAFDDLLMQFAFEGKDTGADLKQFIREALAAQREQIIKEFEGMKVLEVIAPVDTPLKLVYKQWLNKKLDEAVEKIKSSTT